jgi:hypothetical protein
VSDYKLKCELRAVASGPTGGSDIAAAFDPSILLQRTQVVGYERLDVGNARMRGLAADTVDAGAWRHLWLPPSLPYYRGRGAHADAKLGTMTKRLIFSSWNAVPDAVSVLLSLEAERQMMLSRDPNARNTREDRAQLRRLLSIRRQDGGPAGKSTFGFLYPCVTLAVQVDPLSIARDIGATAREISCGELLDEATRRVRALLEPMLRGAPKRRSRRSA